MTLLEKAMAITVRELRDDSTTYSFERAEVALAYCLGTITLKQAKLVLETDGPGAQSVVRGLIFAAIKRGDFKVTVQHELSS